LHVQSLKYRKGVDRLSPIKKGTRLTDNPRNVRLEIRLTKEENDVLSECAKKLCATRTDVVIRGIKMVRESLDEK
jgi:hypothetical protein